MDFCIEDGWDNDNAQAIESDLREYNEAEGHKKRAQKMTVSLKNEDKLLGGATILLAWDYIFIDYLFVRRKRQGYGRKLIEKIEKLAADHGKKGVYAFTSTFQAPQFYKKLGFKESGRVPELTNDCDEILFVKML